MCRQRSSCCRRTGICLEGSYRNSSAAPDEWRIVDSQHMKRMPHQSCPSTMNLRAPSLTKGLLLSLFLAAPGLRAHARVGLAAVCMSRNISQRSIDDRGRSNESKSMIFPDAARHHCLGLSLREIITPTMVPSSICSSALPPRTPPKFINSPPVGWTAVPSSRLQKSQPRAKACD